MTTYGSRQPLASRSVTVGQLHLSLCPTVRIIRFIPSIIPQAIDKKITLKIIRGNAPSK